MNVDNQRCFNVDSTLMCLLGLCLLKDNDEDRVMHSKSDNIEIVINDEADKIIEKLFLSLLSTYQIRLETSMKGGDFIFDCVH